MSKQHTLEQNFDLSDLSSVIELPKVFGLLSEVLSLNESVALMGNKVLGSSIENRQESREVNV